MSSVWFGAYFSMSELLLLVFSILLFMCAGISIMFTFSQICREDYRWWWRSFKEGP